ncbi:MAG: DEAD/DEAH box helicase [Candidatus Sedimenticola sp. (ex Thyasira tokunagai)]
MNLEKLQDTVTSAIETGFRGRLLARGQARSLIWQDGQLPEGAPGFSPLLSYDLTSYGESLLSLGMRIRESQGDANLARAAFEHAGDSLEAVVSKGDPNEPLKDSFRLLSASAFHMAGLSARAYSMLQAAIAEGNLSFIERALALLIVRSLDELEQRIIDWRIDGLASEEALIQSISANVEHIDDDDDPIFAAIDVALTDQFLSGLGTYLTALKTGQPELVSSAISTLRHGQESAGELNMVPQWWCFRLACHLIEDLWKSSFHYVLPINPTGDAEPDWQALRDLYIASLYKRGRAEIELWPSQIDAARRATDALDDLVVSLPTSAGKTRIAELCILRCLSEGKRVVFVTPLRALSAQTEVGLQRTFTSLGKYVSALYGSIGTSHFEGDMLKARDIVVATPEKLDFALRSDPSILDDVGLIVLDEGHMIGLGEREVRYEVQIQRLLKREDADKRRIVCLSAILPDGEQFDDFVNWLRRDKEGGPVTCDWRPTRVRYGQVMWRNDLARLELMVGDESPFVPSFFAARLATKGTRQKPFPNSQQELVLATAWRLLEDGHSILVYCPERRSVNAYPNLIVKLNKQGLLDSALEHDPNEIASALAIGYEWFGKKHPILKCLELGIAIHHGALPTPYRKEVEHLLRKGILRVTVSSPTLAQGLNLTATTVIMHSIQHFRDGKQRPIDVAQFKNVIGRAGRAFVDVEGLVLFPIFDKHNKRKKQWSKLINGMNDHELESGLALLVKKLLMRMHSCLEISGIDNLREYVVNNAATWQFPELQGEPDDQKEQAEADWERNLALLDTAILSLVGERELETAEIANQLDELLASSLWSRLLARNEEVRNLYEDALRSRTKNIWENTNSQQRRGYFLAGVGISSGNKLDEIAGQANAHLINANSRILSTNEEQAVDSITKLAELLFEIPPFRPNPFPNDWRNILTAWLKGQAIADHANDDPDALRFIEDGLIYRLPWGMEAIRVRADANSDNVTNGIDTWDFTDFETGLAAPAVETGTLNRSAAILMQAGFSSRTGAIKAVTDTQATFDSSKRLRLWLASDAVRELSESEDWPTVESHRLWQEFIGSHDTPDDELWSIQDGMVPVWWDDGISIKAGDTVQLHFKVPYKPPVVISAGFKPLGRASMFVESMPKGIFRAVVAQDGAGIAYKYIGPKDLDWLF